jgi:hypothetical protein
LGNLLAEHAMADPEVTSKFMAKALPKFVGAPKPFMPRSPTAAIGKVPAMSANPGVHIASGSPSTLDNVEAEIAHLGEENYAMTLEMERMSERLAQKQVSSDLPLGMGIFSIGAAVGALLYTIAAKMLGGSRDATTEILGSGPELQLTGAEAGAMPVAPVTSSRSGALMMSATVDPPPPAPLPPIKTMRVGDKTLAGDMGFDPLQLADTPDQLAWYREAEVKHARLAMLAAFGWPASEVLNFGKLVTGDGRAPSLLNGGLGNVNGVYWALVLALGAYWESKGLDKKFGKQDDYLPGMLGFDPLGADSPSMRNAEITNGRVAMVAITLFALEEAIIKAPIFPINLFT